MPGNLLGGLSKSSNTSDATRIVSPSLITESKVSTTTRSLFHSYKDYREGAKQKLMTLDAGEFLRRFCLHILHPGFMKDTPLRNTRQPCQAATQNAADENGCVDCEERKTAVAAGGKANHEL